MFQNPKLGSSTHVVATTTMCPVLFSIHDKSSSFPIPRIRASGCGICPKGPGCRPFDGTMIASGFSGLTQISTCLLLVDFYTWFTSLHIKQSQRFSKISASLVSCKNLHIHCHKIPSFASVDICLDIKCFCIFNSFVYHFSYRSWQWYDCVQAGAWTSCICCARQHVVLCQGPLPPPAGFQQQQRHCCHAATQVGHIHQKLDCKTTPLPSNFKYNILFSVILVGQSSLSSACLITLQRTQCSSVL